MMNQLTIILILSILLPVEVFADNLLRTGAETLASHFLEKCNQRDGLEYFGGTSKLSEFTCKTSYDELEESVFFHYHRSREKCPAYFTIYAKSFTKFKLPSLGALSPDTIVKSTSTQQAQLLESLPLDDLFMWTFCYKGYEEADVYSVTVDKEGNVVKNRLPSINIHSIVQKEKDTIDVFLGPSLWTDFYRYQPFALCLDRENNGSWKVDSINQVSYKGTQVREFTEPFLYFGEPDEKELLKVLRVLENIENIGRISGIEFINNSNYASVYFGQDDKKYPFGSPYLGKPRMLFRCQYQKGEWYLVMQSAIHCEEYDERCELFIPDIPTDNLPIDQIELYIPPEIPTPVRNQFKKQDWPELVKVLHRIEWFEELEDLTVSVQPDPNVVSADIWQSSVVFIKQNGQWLFSCSDGHGGFFEGINRDLPENELDED